MVSNKLFVVILLIFALGITNVSAVMEFSEKGNIRENADLYWDDDEFEFFTYVIPSGETLELELVLRSANDIYIMIFHGEDEYDIDDALKDLINGVPRGDVYDLASASSGRAFATATASSEREVSVAVFSYSIYPFSTDFTLYSNIEEGYPLTEEGAHAFFLISAAIVFLIAPLRRDEKDFLSFSFGLLYMAFGFLMIQLDLDNGFGIALFGIPVYLYFIRRVSLPYFEKNILKKIPSPKETPGIIKLIWAVLLFLGIGISIESFLKLLNINKGYVLLISGAFIATHFLVIKLVSGYYRKINPPPSGPSPLQYSKVDISTQKPQTQSFQYQDYRNQVENRTQNPQTQSLMFCTNCGTKVTGVFCGECGNKTT